MGYRPDDQSIQDPLEKIAEGIKEFDAAVLKRLESGEWMEEHNDELEDLSLEFRRQRKLIAQLIRNHW